MKSLNHLRFGSVILMKAGDITYELRKEIKDYDKNKKSYRSEWVDVYNCRMRATNHCVVSWGYKIKYESTREEHERHIRQYQWNRSV